MLIRAVGNLLGNAIKFSPRGSSIDCVIDHRGGDAMLQIRDHGDGMDADEVALLFRRFSTNVQRGASRREGVGLGLAFVQAVIHGHGGTIACESRKGEGTVFTMKLPLQSEPGQRNDGAAAARP